jgi:Outer membrane efflux protein
MRFVISCIFVDRSLYDMLKKPGVLGALIALVLFLGPADLFAQKKGRAPKPKTKTQKPVDELTKLRAEFVEATNEYKANLEKLFAIYNRNVTRAEERLAQTNLLFAQGLVSKNQVEAEQKEVAEARDKVAETKLRISNADTQIAQTLLEAEAEKNMARVVIPKGGLVQTASYIRFNGGAAWALTDAWKVQRFFQDAFKRPLPIAVFGQGAIHDRWRLDHHNSMDISLHPDGAEGQSLLAFLRSNGIPFLAFRGAIPGTATGPHIHIGRPSHRY